MNKLKLDLDELAVESFETCGGDREKGTVLGQELCTCPGVTCANTCAPTCAYTCDDVTCANSCEGTCHGISCFTRCIDSCICP